MPPRMPSRVAIRWPILGKKKPPSLIRLMIARNEFSRYHARWSRRTFWLRAKCVWLDDVCHEPCPCDAVHGHASQLNLQIEVWWMQDRKSTRLNSSHTVISYAVF